MPPHCDSLDGPVVRAAEEALAAANVDLVLPYVPEDGEREVIAAFDDVIAARRTGVRAREVADRYFFETVVRIHRRGEGAAFTGLRPAGLDVGPVIPIAERAIESGNAEDLEEILVATVREELADRFEHMRHLHHRADRGVEGARAYVQAMLGLQVWAHGVYQAAHAAGHAAAHTHE